MPRTHHRIMDEITAAIQDGIGHDQIRLVHTGRHQNHIFVYGHDKPIVVKSDDVILPDGLQHMGPGIRLDVQAILTSRDRPPRRVQS